MNTKHMFSGIDFKFYSFGDLLSRAQLRLKWTSWMGPKQWLVLFGLGLAVILVEFRNHFHMWHEHNSGQTVWTDPELIWEIILFGIVFPILAGIVLEYTGRTAIERDKMAKAMKLRQALVEQLNEAQSWPELADLIVTTPANVISAERTWLLAQRSDEEKFDQIAYWERSPGQLLSHRPQVIPSVCAQCMKNETVKGTKIFHCQKPDPNNNADTYTRYCRWLSSEEEGKTALVIDVPRDHPLNLGQINVLDDLGNEMSLAIVNAHLNYDKQRKIDRVTNERQRIARNLHDTLGQNISYLRLKLEQLNSGWMDTSGDKFQEDLTKMLRVADDAYEQVRDTLEELRSVENNDLEQAVREYAAQISERACFLVHVSSSGQPEKLSARSDRQIMYILREALNNVEKHAQAQNVNIYLSWQHEKFELSVQDDGVGFQASAIDAVKRYGLTIMAERSRSINANLVVESMPEEGTKVSLCIPLSKSVTFGSYNE